MPLYVLTNEIRLNGASVLFYTDCLKRFASDIGRDFFVLPSSIHEVLLLPVMDEMSAWGSETDRGDDESSGGIG